MLDHVEKFEANIIPLSFQSCKYLSIHLCLSDYHHRIILFQLLFYLHKQAHNFKLSLTTCIPNRIDINWSLQDF